MNYKRNKISSFHWIFLFTGLLCSVRCNDQSEQAGHDEIHNTNSIDLSTISLPTNYSVISSQKAVKPIWSESGLGTSANGYIGVDERRDNKISARFSGRIEKLFVKYNFQYVKKGERIMEIYSAELNTAQEELLLLIKDNTEANLVRKAKEKLLLMGLSDLQLQDIESSEKILDPVTLLSPYEGFVYFSNLITPSQAEPNTQPSQMGGMGMSGSSSSDLAITASEFQIREGSYVIKGQTLFKVNDLKEVVGIVLIDNSHSAEISVGANVELISELDKDVIINAKIDLLEPVLQNGQKFLSARVYLKNEPGFLKINSLLTAKFFPAGTRQLMVPNSTVLFIGRRKIVWMKTGVTDNGNNIFQVRDIVIGVSQGNMTAVSSGLTDKDEIALDAGYMLDRESLIKSK